MRLSITRPNPPTRKENPAGSSEIAQEAELRKVSGVVGRVALFIHEMLASPES
jgi:hypothetical protein